MTIHTPDKGLLNPAPLLSPSLKYLTAKYYTKIFIGNRLYDYYFIPMPPCICA